MLVTADFAADLLAIFNAMKSSPMSEDEYAQKIAAVFDKHIKTATVTVAGVQNGGGSATGSLT